MKHTFDASLFNSLTHWMVDSKEFYLIIHLITLRSQSQCPFTLWHAHWNGITFTMFNYRAVENA